MTPSHLVQSCLEQVTDSWSCDVLSRCVPFGNPTVAHGVVPVKGCCSPTRCRALHAAIPAAQTHHSARSWVRRIRRVLTHQYSSTSRAAILPHVRFRLPAVARTDAETVCFSRLCITISPDLLPPVRHRLIAVLIQSVAISPAGSNHPCQRRPSRVFLSRRKRAVQTCG